jgi:hypothetical protein
MARIFVSFLGMGPDGEGYSELNYKMEGKAKSITTEFVQRAEIEFLGSERRPSLTLISSRNSEAAD